MAKLTVKVVPGATREAIVGWLGDQLKLKVRSPPEKGKANAAVIALLAKEMGVPARSIEVCRGHTGRIKVVEFTTLSDAELRKRLP